MSRNKSYYHRYGNRKHRRNRDRPRKGLYENPRLDPQLKGAFRKIGIPDRGPFTPDEFQLKALDLIKEYDVLVSAPTGAGKTWIASQTIQSYLSQNLKTWYASPLKALSNSIYQEFSREFGCLSCGILTGDRKENPDAPIIVGTTEILRNQLYDAMHEGRSINTDLVILDEAHYLSDVERGVVWEEVLIYLPSRVRLLLLSATISNAEEVCMWLRDIRGVPNRIVHAESRPVPLKMLFLFPDGLIAPLGGKKGLHPKIEKFIGDKSVRRRGRAKQVDYGGILRVLRKVDLLPAIFFLKSRADCDRALEACPPARTRHEAREHIKRTVNKFLKEFPHLKGHRQMKPLMKSMVGSHHGGQLPYWKVLIEKMMAQGCLDAIFSTSTVAAGVNFPARTVILVQSDRFNGHEFVDLTATDLHQMIGRAGRRGKDNIGFSLIIPGRHQDPRLIHKLQGLHSEPILSQIQINFSMTLNLLLSNTPLEVKDLLDLSFSTFQKRKGVSLTSRNKGKKEKGLWTDFMNHVAFLKETGFVDERDRLTSDGFWASKLRLDQPLLIAEVIRKGGLAAANPETLAGCLAPFVWDRMQEVELKSKGFPDISGLKGVFDEMVDCIKDIRTLKEKRGFDSPPIVFWPCAALFMWARGMTWEKLLDLVRVDEGDMASLIMRTADHLRQIINLRETHLELASVADKAIELILREPVYIF